MSEEFTSKIDGKKYIRDGGVGTPWRLKPVQDIRAGRIAMQSVAKAGMDLTTGTGDLLNLASQYLPPKSISWTDGGLHVEPGTPALESFGWPSQVFNPEIKSRYERLTGYPYVDPGDLTPGDETALNIGAGTVGAVASGGPGGGLMRGVAERSLLPLVTEVASAGAGAGAAEYARRSGAGGLLQTGAGVVGGVPAAVGAQAGGAVVRGAYNSIIPGAAESALRERAGNTLLHNVGGMEMRDTGVDALTSALEREAQGAPGVAPTANILRPVTGGGVDALNQGLAQLPAGSAYESRAAALRRSNVSDLDAAQRRFAPGDPTDIGPGYEAAGIRQHPTEANPYGRSAIAQDVTAAYGRLREAPGYGLVGVDTTPIKDAAAELRLMAKRGDGINESLLPEDIVQRIERMPDKWDLDNLEAVRQRLGNDARTTEAPTTQMALTRLKTALDQAENRAIEDGDALVQGMSLYGGRADPVFAQRAEDLSEALTRAKAARAARTEQSRLLEGPSHSIAEKWGSDHDAVIRALSTQPEGEMRKYIDVLRRIPDPTARKKALEGFERSWIRNSEPANVRELTAGRASSLSDLTPMAARRFAAELRDPELGSTRLRALAALGARNPREAGARVEELAKLSDRVGELLSSEVGTPNTLRRQTGNTLRGNVPDAYDAAEELITSPVQSVKGFLRDRIKDDVQMRALLSDAMLDKQLSRDLLANITPARYAAWAARMDHALVRLARGGARASGAGLRATVPSIATQESR